MLNFTQEQLEAARAAKSPDELVAKAQDAGLTLTRAQAKSPDELSGELADEQLKNVTGGYLVLDEAEGAGPLEEGRTIPVGHKCAYSQCKKSGSLYARTADERGFYDVKCYACGGLHPIVWADGSVG